MTKKKVSSVDVANRAGVSQATVSMVLNHKYNVSFSKETIRKVEDAARELGYVLPAGRLRKQTKKEKLIIVFCSNLTNPYYVMLLEGIESRANEEGLGVYVCNTQRNLKMEEYYLKMARQLRPSGIIYTFNPSVSFTKTIEEIGKQIPVVVISNQNEKMGVDLVDMDNSKIGRITAEYLLSLGHKEVAYITPPLTRSQRQRSKRVEGFVREFEKAGLKEHVTIKKAKEDVDMRFAHSDSEYKMGYELTKDVLKENKFITAIVGLNDMIAFGILDALEELKVKVPGDISVVGCDNVLFGQLRHSALTTVEHFVIYKGRDACEIILKKMRNNTSTLGGKTPLTTYRIEYEPELIIRGTTGYPKTVKNK